MFVEPRGMTREPIATPLPIAKSHSDSSVEQSSPAPSQAPKPKVAERSQPKVHFPVERGSVQLPEALRGGWKNETNMHVTPETMKALQNVDGLPKANYRIMIGAVPHGSRIHGPRGSRDLEPGSIIAPDEYVGADQSSNKAMHAVHIGLAIAGTAAGGLLVGYLAADIWFRNRLINNYYGGYGGGFMGYGGY